MIISVIILLLSITAFILSILSFTKKSENFDGVKYPIRLDNKNFSPCWEGQPDCTCWCSPNEACDKC